MIEPEKLLSVDPTATPSLGELMELVDDIVSNPGEADYSETQLPIVQAKDLLSVLEELVKTGLNVKVAATIMVTYEPSEGAKVEPV